MKTLSLFAALMIWSVGLKAQDYQISFTASGQSNMIDSILVENLTQDTMLMLAGGDVLNLVGSLGIISPVNMDKSLVIYPNPTRENAMVEYFLADNGEVIIELMDLSGKIIVSHHYDGYPGKNIAELKGLTAGYYILAIRTQNIKQSAQMICTNPDFGNPSLRILSPDGPGIIQDKLKSTDNIIKMQYNDGDRLLIKGYSGTFRRQVSLIPASSQTINFEFTPCTDKDGNHYPVVSIGNQTWMAENLYVNAGNTVKTFGKLYDHYEVMEENLCPAGWHVPSDEEWTEMTVYLITHGYNYDNSTIGNRVAKALASTNAWSYSDAVGTVGNIDYPSKRNASGFTALPGGWCDDQGTLHDLYNQGNWWTSTETNENEAFFRVAFSTSNEFHRNYTMKDLGLSVRCMKD